MKKTQTATLKQQKTDLAAEIKDFQFDGNFVELLFYPNVYSKEQIETMLNNCGIKNIIYSHTNMNGTKVEGHSFVLHYVNDLNQKAVVNDLESYFIRMKALKELFHNGGFKLTAEERKHFKQR